MTTAEATRRQAQGKRLKAARDAFGISRDALAELITRQWTRATDQPVSRDFVRRVEAGERDAEVGYVRTVAALTGDALIEAEITERPLIWLLGDLNRDMGLSRSWWRRFLPVPLAA